MAWTDEQLAAMQKGGGNLLVSAGAGSGKTAVLIERVLGIITDENEPVDVDDLLILTYTNAAASEMRARLAQALARRLAEQPGNVYLNRQLVLLPRARIMTIHAFCRDLLKENGYMLGLDTKSHIGSEGELALLRERTLDDVFEAAYADENSGLKELLRHYCRGIGDENLRALVLRLIEFGQSMPDVLAWLDSLGTVYAEGRADTWVGYFAECLSEGLAEHAARLFTAQRLAETAGLTKHVVLLAAEAGSLAELAERSKDQGSLQEVLSALAAIKFKNAPPVRAKEDIDIAAKDRVLALRKRAREGVSVLLREGRVLLSGGLEAELAELKPLALALINLARQYYQAWQQAKRRAKLLEFADLEHYALALLQKEEFGLAADLRRCFYEILVDEYQDINEVQEQLLSLLSNGQNRFMVGDIKQSIYRFRLAEPGLFMAKFAAYGEGDGGRRIDLNRNFRSQSGVLAGVNFIFAQLLTGGHLEITYDAAAQLYCGRPELTAAPCELLIIDREAVRGEAAEDDENPLVEMQNAELEASLLAERILAEHAAGRDWGDMVVLLRAVKSWAPVMARVLSAQGIPCRTDGQEDFLRLPEVQVVLTLLTVLDNPRQDIPLAALLHSPLVGLKLADLADLRRLVDIPAGECLYDGLCQSHEPRLLEFALKLDVWRQQSRELSVFDLLDYLYNETALPELMGSLSGGDLRRQNLAELMRLAAEYDENGGLGLSRFLRYLTADKRQTQTVEQADAVRIMSIHKSKGLEFPVVFVAGISGKFNEDDFKQDILLHRALGLGMRRVELDKRRKYPTFGFNMIMRKARWENLAEALRILYVAMTRAEQKLVLVGTVPSLSMLAKQLAAMPENSISAGFLAERPSYLSWLAAALLSHKDGGELRELAGFGVAGKAAAAIPGADGDWRIEIVDHIARPEVPAEQDVFSYNDWLAMGETADEAEINALLARNYPAAELSRLPVKWSATAFARLEPQPLDEGIPLDPLDEAVQKLAYEAAEETAHPSAWYAETGVLTHKLLEKADLSLLSQGENAAAHLEDLWREYAPDFAPDVAQAVSPGKLAQFFASGLGKRLLAAAAANQTVLREQRFTANLTLAELAALDGMAYQNLLHMSGIEHGAYPEEGLFLQGVIDLAFAETDGWVLVDYKSGGGGKSDGAVREKYGLQLALYRKALTTALKTPVKAGYIYFTSTGRVVKIF